VYLPTPIIVSAIAQGCFDSPTNCAVVITWTYADEFTNNIQWIEIERWQDGSESNTAVVWKR
jgi:hypothetical protein